MGNWFALHYSLRRLILVSIFLGMLLGLNLRPIGPMNESSLAGSPNMLVSRYRGWPLPVMKELEDWDQCTALNGLGDIRRADHDTLVKNFMVDWDARLQHARSYRFPFTHITYHLVDCDLMCWLSSSENRLWACRTVDLIVLLVGVALILFVRLPSRPSKTIKVS